MPLNDQNPSDQSGTYNRPQKRIFLFLLGLTVLLVISALALLYLLPLYGFDRIHAQFGWVVGILMGAAGCVVLVALFLLIIATVLGRDVPFSQKLRSVSVKVLLPVLITVGKLVGLKKEYVQHAFVAVNNELILAQCRNGRPPRKILLLMPHCLQNNDCAVKITGRVENCKRCGKCSIKSLLELADQYGVDLAVATGGTIARRIVIEKRPDLIIAVACERDLTSGIQDTTPLPVYGIFNQRPFGPCLNTQVALDHVESVLREIVSLRRTGS